MHLHNFLNNLRQKLGLYNYIFTKDDMHIHHPIYYNCYDISNPTHSYSFQGLSTIFYLIGNICAQVFKNFLPNHSIQKYFHNALPHEFVFAKLIIFLLNGFIYIIHPGV